MTLTALLALLWTLPALALPSSNDTSSPPIFEIVGGEPAESGDWPDAAAVFVGSGVHCMGVLIAEDLVLTAAHCAFGLSEVVLNSNDYTVGGEVLAVADQVAHEDSWNTFDIALIMLDEPSAVAPRPLALDCVASTFLIDGAQAIIVGYGATDNMGETFGTVLQQAEVTIVDHDCSNLSAGCNMAVSPDGELIAGGEGVDSCDGDSGGPLYLQTPLGTFLAGITSRAAQPASVPCGDGGIYVRADAIAPWIEEVTERSLPRPECDESIYVAKGPPPTTIDQPWLIGPAEEDTGQPEQPRAACGCTSLTPKGSLTMLALMMALLARGRRSYESVG